MFGERPTIPTFTRNPGVGRAGSSTDFINIPVSSGCCGSIVSTVDTNNGESNGSVSLTTTSGFSSVDYNLYTINDELVYSQTNSSDLVQIGNLSAGTYYLTVDDFAGCSGITESFIIKSSTCTLVKPTKKT